MNDPTPSLKSGLWVRKRDGTAEPLQRSKLVALLNAALQTSGEGDPSDALELSESICSAACSSRESGPLKTRHIAALVQRALQESGRVSSAERIREISRHRDYLRRQVRVLAWKSSVGRRVPRQWNKTVLVNRLMKTQGLEAMVARLVAGRVEEIVLSIGLRVVTGGLVAELAASEMLAWGFSSESDRPITTTHARPARPSS